MTGSGDQGMKVGIAFNFGYGFADLLEMVEAADAFGYDAAFISDGLFDQFAALTACARRTSRIRLATGVASVYARQPTWLALSAMTLDAASDGRALLGIGVGHPENCAMRDDVEPGRPLPFVRGTQRLRETTEIVRRMVRASHEGEVVDFEGSIFTVDRWTPKFDAVRPEIPIYIGALGPRNLALAGEIADGVIAAMLPMNAIGAHFTGPIDQGRERAGRSPSDVEVLSYVPTAVHDDVSVARQAVEQRLILYIARFVDYQRHFTSLGFGEVVEQLLAAAGGERSPSGDYSRCRGIIPDELLRMTCAYGTGDDCAATLSGFHRAGVVPVVDCTNPGLTDMLPTRATLAAFTRDLREIAGALGLTSTLT